MITNNKVAKIIIILLISLVISNTTIAFDETELRDELKSAFINRKNNLNLTLQVPANQISSQQLEIIIEETRIGLDDYYTESIAGWSYNLSSNNQKVEVQLEIKHLSNQNEDDYVFKKVETIAREIANPKMNVDEQIKVLNDYIMSKIKYDDSLINETAYDALTKGVTTCRGYALLTYLLLDELGIENQIVVGQLRGEDELHAWNLVEVDNERYHLDLTQNAAHYHQNGTGLTYGWYNLSDDALSLTHAWDQSFYPAANTNYYERLKNKSKGNEQEFYNALIKELKLYYLDNDYLVRNEQDLLAKLEAAIRENKPEVSFRAHESFFNPELINQTLARIESSRNFTMEGINYYRDGFANSMIIKVNFR